ncbi:MAG: hypothetical protein IPO08_05735 [Xanthomonadales bacterium]|nr:hypothetical protein [Xanthomonadales bacterium]
MREVESFVVAERELLFSLKGKCERQRFAVQIYSPHLVTAADVSFAIDSGTACCRVVFLGLGESDYLAYGADTLQALALAVDVDPILRGMSKKYDFFFDSGESYFE